MNQNNWILRFFLILVIIIINTNHVYPSDNIALKKYLPLEKNIKGFKTLSGSLIYGKGDDITKVYDGGYELYTNNGVVDVLRGLYVCKKDYVELTIHTMKSAKSASDFLKYWQSQNKTKKLDKKAKSIGFDVINGNLIAYRIWGKYFYTISSISPINSKSNVDLFINAVDKRFEAK